MGQSNILDEKALLKLGKKLAAACPDTAVIFLYGQLGTGKTTLARGFLLGLGYSGKVKSPTYTLVEPYEIKKQKVFHFDFYHVHKAYELELMGIQDYFVPHAICLIEWPENGAEFLPHPDVSCFLEIAGSGRTVKLEAGTERGELILQRLNNEK